MISVFESSSFPSSRAPGSSIPADGRRGALLSDGSMARSVSVFSPLVDTLGSDQCVPTSGSLPSRLSEATVRQHQPWKLAFVLR